jgi:CarD family transcriptional regulator
MMGFSIGDKVVHPKFGAGQIIDEKHRELVEGFEHYFVIKINSTGATAYVPVGKMEDLGVRLVMSRPKLGQMFDTLCGVPSRLSQDYKKRQARIREKLETGRPLLIAEAVRDLAWRRELKRLTQKDEALLDRGIQFLAREMAVARDIQEIDARESIDSALQGAIETGVEEAEAAYDADAREAAQVSSPA